MCYTLRGEIMNENPEYPLDGVTKEEIIEYIQAAKFRMRRIETAFNTDVDLTYRLDLIDRVGLAIRNELIAED